VLQDRPAPRAADPGAQDQSRAGLQRVPLPRKLALGGGPLNRRGQERPEGVRLADEGQGATEGEPEAAERGVVIVKTAASVIKKECRGGRPDRGPGGAAGGGGGGAQTGGRAAAGHGDDEAGPGAAQVAAALSAAVMTLTGR
jgi:hypothetical protein